MAVIGIIELIASIVLAIIFGNAKMGAGAVIGSLVGGIIVFAYFMIMQSLIDDVKSIKKTVDSMALYLQQTTQYNAATQQPAQYAPVQSQNEQFTPAPQTPAAPFAGTTESN